MFLVAGCAGYLVGEYFFWRENPKEYRHHPGHISLGLGAIFHMIAAVFGH